MRNPLLTLVGCAVSGLTLSAQGSFQAPGLRIDSTELAGRSLSTHPYFTHVLAFNEGAPVELALDTLRYPELAEREVDVYVLPHRFPGEWTRDPSLFDVSGVPLTVETTASGLPENVFVLDPGQLLGTTGTTEIGIGYDVVVDVNQDGELDRSDLIDGWGGTAGLYVVQDLTLAGPYTPTEVLFNGGGALRQLDVYYPAEIGTLGELPVCVVSHGNGHSYRWYDHIGNFLSSWGYIVVSQSNNTGPGIEAAATTTIRNTNMFLAKLDEIAGGVLREHVDARRMMWIGHSRGGEGIVRAYDRVLEGDPLAVLYTAADIKLLSSIAPTNFLGPAKVTPPADVIFHVWTGGSDSDVNGCAGCNICQTFQLHDRAKGERLSTSLHGVGHGDFHAGSGGAFANGPCRVGRTDTHAIMRGYLLPLVKHALEENKACKEYLWRQWEDLRPIGAPESNPCVVVDLMFQERPNPLKRVVDDFQEGFEPSVSSSQGRVLYNVENLLEGLLNDTNNQFNPDPTDPMNGMTLAGPGDDSRGIVFDWNGTDASILFEVRQGARNLERFRYVSFRAAQATRHALTTMVLEDLTFSVRLWDVEGQSSTLSIGAYGGGIEEPYQRPKCGSTGTGWANEWETLRIPLEDFRTNGNPLRLQRIVGIEFLFGPNHGSPEGRIGLDEIEFTRS